MLFLTLEQSASAALSATEEESGAEWLLRYERGLVSARIDDIPLGSVLQALERATGTRVRLMDPATAVRPVSAHFDNLPLAQAARLITRELSSLYWSSGDARVLYVFSSSPVQGVRSDASTGFPDFAHASGASARYGEEMQEAAHQLSESEPTRQLMAIGQLSGIQDERAIEALSRAASAGETIDVRVSAASALAQSAAATPDKETTSLDALRRLRDDSDAHVRAVARQALHDIEQQRREIVETNIAQGDADGAAQPEA